MIQKPSEVGPIFFSSRADLILGVAKIISSRAKIFCPSKKICPRGIIHKRGGGAEYLILAKERLVLVSSMRAFFIRSRNIFMPYGSTNLCNLLSLFLLQGEKKKRKDSTFGSLYYSSCRSHSITEIIHRNSFFLNIFFLKVRQ